MRYFLKLNWFFLFIFLIACTKNAEYQDVYLNFPQKIVKIDGKFASFIPSDSFELLKNINSDDCDSWKLNIKFSDLFNKSYKKLLNSMLEDVTFTDNVLSSDVLEAKNFISFIHFEKSKAKINFKTERNTGKLQISLYADIKIQDSRMTIENTIKSEQSWEKNIYLNCEVADGALKISEKAFETFISQIHENIYKSIRKITR